MTDTQNIEKKRPTKRLVQEKAYFKTDSSGRQVRHTEMVEITRGWDEVSREHETPYISWATSTVPVFPDVDGKIKLLTFEINYED